MVQISAPVAGIPAHDPNKKITDLQILRGVAIIAVLAQHLSITPTLLERLPIKITMPFFVGVEIFFVISGYIITTILMRDGYSAPRFLTKRVFRLLPAILVFLCLSGLVNIIFRTLPLPESTVRSFSVPADAFFRQGASVVGGYFTFLGESSFCNGAMWSLSVEDQFYGAIALVMAISGGLLRFRKTTVEPLIGWLAFALFATIQVMRFAILARYSTSGFPWILHYLTAWRFDFIAAGILLAFLDRRVRDSLRIKFADSGPMLCAYALSGIFGIIAVCESPFAADKHYLDGLAMPLVCIATCFVTILAANGLAFPKVKGLVARCLERIGDRSYTYYLLHYPVFAIVWLIALGAIPWAFRGAKAYGTVQLIGTALLLIPLAELVYRRIELPAIKVGRKLVDRWFPIHEHAQTIAALSTVTVPQELVDAEASILLMEPSSSVETKSALNREGNSKAA